MLNIYLKYLCQILQPIGELTALMMPDLPSIKKSKTEEIENAEATKSCQW